MSITLSARYTQLYELGDINTFDLLEPLVELEMNFDKLKSDNQKLEDSNKLLKAKIEYLESLIRTSETCFYAAAVLDIIKT